MPVLLGLETWDLRLAVGAAMPTEPKIVFAPTLDSEVLAIGQELLPRGFQFQMVSGSELPSALADADFLMGFIPALSDETLLGAKQLKLVQLMSVGYDKFNLEGARKANLPVAVNGGANAISVAEHAIMLMLTTLKHVTELDHRVRSGAWRSADHGGLRIHELCTSTVGIVGMGRIGQEVARRLQGWQARLLYYDPYRLNSERE